MAERPVPARPAGAEKKVCPECGRSFYNAWAHAEECTGAKA